jgi:hypothetical protein
MDPKIVSLTDLCDFADTGTVREMALISAML